MSNYVLHIRIKVPENITKSPINVTILVNRNKKLGGAPISLVENKCAVIYILISLIVLSSFSSCKRTEPDEAEKDSIGILLDKDFQKIKAEHKQITEEEFIYALIAQSQILSLKRIMQDASQVDKRMDSLRAWTYYSCLITSRSFKNWDAYWVAKQLTDLGHNLLDDISYNYFSDIKHIESDLKPCLMAIREIEKYRLIKQNKRIEFERGHQQKDANSDYVTIDIDYSPHSYMYMFLHADNSHKSKMYHFDSKAQPRGLYNMRKGMYEISIGGGDGKFGVSHQYTPETKEISIYKSCSIYNNGAFLKIRYWY